VFEKRMDDKGVGGWASTTGSDHGKFNAGGKSFSPQFVAELLDGGLRDELTEMGFSKAAFMDGTGVTKEDLSPKSVDDRIDDELSSYGLSQPLALK
jgi:hypothetical protein